MSLRLDPAGGSVLSRPGRWYAAAAVLPVALALDVALGEPPAGLHPVVWLGRAISALEGYAPAGRLPRLVYGGVVTVAVVGLTALVGALTSRLVARLPAPVGLLVEAWLLKTTLSVRGLVEAGSRVESCLDRGDLAGARMAARSLVSRDVAGLSSHQLASAAVESLAENTADSVVAPLLYYAVGGLPAAFAYRAANTLDAMIGYRGVYEHLGKVAARLDDVLNLLPARLSSALLIAGGAVAGGDLGSGIASTLRDHGRTASPNAGWPMSTMAGLLGTRLEKPGHYVLGAELPPPDVPAIDHAAEIVKAATALALPVVLGVHRLVRPLTPRPGGAR